MICSSKIFFKKVEVVPVEEMWQRTWNSENYGRECWFGGRVLRDWILGFSYVRGGDPASVINVKFIFFN